MTISDVFVCLVAGFAVPLAIVDLVKALTEGHLPVQEGGARFERRMLPWFLALVAGPGLLVDRLAELWHLKSIGAGDLVSGTLIAFGWAFIYGFVFLQLARAVGGS
jgi:hypothetical protein